ncbi:MAG TPA: NAD-dependent deacylase [Noviherbaspirillum sp.]
MQFDPALIAALRAATRLVVFTGAGVSAESGVPTFRDALTGLWARFRAEDLATPQAFAHDPQLVWQWYEWRRELMRSAQPNPAHRAIAELQQRVETVVLTQNVDGLHQRAGSRHVIELHGNIWRNRCSACAAKVDCPEPHPSLLHCPHCGALARPDVIWFGESLPQTAWEEGFRHCTSAEVFFCVGTSSLVEPAASLPSVARASGARVVQLNPVATAHDALAHHVLRGPAGVILPALLQAAWPAG